MTLELIIEHLVKLERKLDNKNQSNNLDCIKTNLDYIRKILDNNLTDLSKEINHLACQNQNYSTTILNLIKEKNLNTNIIELEKLILRQQETTEKLISLTTQTHCTTISEIAKITKYYQ